MKKFNFLLFILSFICIISLTSCGKVSKFNNQNYGKIKYYVAGLYIQVNEYDEYSIDDPNPKIYFDFSAAGNKFAKLTTNSGTLNAAMNISDISKITKVEDDINKYYMTAKVSFVNSDVEKIKLYPIYVDEKNELVVDEELFESVNLNTKSSYNYMVDFTRNKIKYQLQMKLLFK